MVATNGDTLLGTHIQAMIAAEDLTMIPRRTAFHIALLLLPLWCGFACSAPAQPLAYRSMPGGWVSKLTNLEILEVEGTGITDEGLAHLQGLQNLGTLWLLNAPITDAGLRDLEGLKSLYFVEFWKSRVTDVGAFRWQERTGIMCIPRPGPR